MDQQQDNQQDLQAELEAARAEIAKLKQRNTDLSAARAYTRTQLEASRAECAKLEQAHQCQLWDLRALHAADHGEFGEERAGLHHQLEGLKSEGEKRLLEYQADREEYLEKLAEIENAT